VNCPACQELLQQLLDGTEPVDQVALDEHVRSCADCRSYHEIARRLQGGLKSLRLPAPPLGFSARVVAVVQEDLRRARRRVRLRFALGCAIAASVAVAVAIRLWPAAPTQVPRNDVVKKENREPQPAPAVASMTPRRSVETAVEAMASLTSRTTSQTVDETRKLMPLVEPTLPEMPWDTAMPTLSLHGAGHGVSEGFEPMATHAKRAVDLLRRDLIPDF
jgi:hypothetical protein